MKILAVGDLIGSAGIRKLKSVLPELRKKEGIDFVIVNGENSAEGMGITEKNFKEILEEKVDVITMGNHTWGKKISLNLLIILNWLDQQIILKELLVKDIIFILAKIKNSCY